MNFKLTHLAVLFILFLPALAVGANIEPYAPLVGIPGVDNASDINAYINALYALSISIAALLAVIKIIIAGVKWMLSDIVTDKSEAKKDIWNATIGLLIVIAAVLILGVINPQLTETNVFVDEIEPRPQAELAERDRPAVGEGEIMVDGGPAGENRCLNDPDNPGGRYVPNADALGQGACIIPAKDGSFATREDSYRCTLEVRGQGEDDVSYNCGFAEAACIKAGGLPEVQQSLEVEGQVQDQPRVVRCYPEKLLCDDIADANANYTYVCNNQIAECKDGNGRVDNGVVFCE